MTDKYDLPFDMTEYTAVRDAFDALPAAQLPDSLSAAALFARMDAQDAAAPVTKAPALDIRQLRRGMAIAACGVLVVAAYVGLSQAGMLGGKTASNAALTAQNEAAPAASSAAAAEAAPEAAPEEMMLYMAGGSADNGAEAASAEEAPAEDIAVDAAADSPAPESKEASMTSADTVSEEELLDAASPDIDDSTDLGNPLLPNPDDGPFPAPEGYTYIADSTQSPGSVLAEKTGVTAERLAAAFLAYYNTADMDVKLTVCEIYDLAASDSGDGSYALRLVFNTQEISDDNGGVNTPWNSGTGIFYLLPVDGGYDLMGNDFLIAHFAV